MLLIPVIELEVSGEVIVATCESGFEKLAEDRKCVAVQCSGVSDNIALKPPCILLHAAFRRVAGFVGGCGFRGNEGILQDADFITSMAATIEATDGSSEADKVSMRMGSNNLVPIGHSSK